VRGAAKQWRPEGSATQGGGVRDRVAQWWAEVQHFAAEREVELRDALGLDVEDEEAV